MDPAGRRYHPDDLEAERQRVLAEAEQRMAAIEQQLGEALDRTVEKGDFLLREWSLRGPDALDFRLRVDRAVSTHGDPQRVLRRELARAVQDRDRGRIAWLVRECDAYLDADRARAFVADALEVLGTVVSGPDRELIALYRQLRTPEGRSRLETRLAPAIGRVRRLKTGRQGMTPQELLRLMESG